MINKSLLDFQFAIWLSNYKMSIHVISFKGASGRFSVQEGLWKMYRIYTGKFFIHMREISFFFSFFFVKSIFLEEILWLISGSSLKIREVWRYHMYEVAMFHVAIQVLPYFEKPQRYTPLGFPYGIPYQPVWLKLPVWYYPSNGSSPVCQYKLCVPTMQIHSLDIHKLCSWGLRVPWYPQGRLFVVEGWRVKMHWPKLLIFSVDQLYF